MAMNAQELKAKMKARIYNGLKEEFMKDVAKGKGYTPEADAMWNRLAEAISGVALDIVTEIVTNGEVQAGIPTAGSPAAQATVASGKIV